MACNLRASALCTADVGRVFPSPRYPLRVSDRSKQLAVDGWNDLSCAASDDKTLTSQMVYDVSACDVLDEGLDILYSHGDVFHKHSSLPQWKYWTLVVLSIILVRFLSYNVQTMWERTEQQDGAAARDQRLALVCSLAIVIVIVADGDSTYVTTADQLFFWCTVAYIGVYLGIHVWLGYLSRRFYARLFTPVVEPPQEYQDGNDDDRDGAEAEADGGGEANEEDTHPAANGYEQPVYNVIVATLQLVAVRFYSSAETPYNMVLLAMLACRVW